MVTSGPSTAENALVRNCCACHTVHFITAQITVKVQVGLLFVHLFIISLSKYQSIEFPFRNPYLSLKKLLCPWGLSCQVVGAEGREGQSLLTCIHKEKACIACLNAISPLPYCCKELRKALRQKIQESEEEIECTEAQRKSRRRTKCVDFRGCWVTRRDEIRSNTLRGAHREEIQSAVSYPIY